VGHAKLPPPPRFTFEQMASGREDCQPAEIEGIVRSVTPTGLVLAMGESRVDVTCSNHRADELATYSIWWMRGCVCSGVV
jgi:hypothetical protein